MMYFKKETLNKAYEILNEIGKNINKLEELQKNKKNLTISEKELTNQTSKFNQNLEETKECHKKILNYSNQYYELMPFTDERN